jgi:hypothetical protein
MPQDYALDDDAPPLRVAVFNVKAKKCTNGMLEKLAFMWFHPKRATFMLWSQVRMLGSGGKACNHI